MDWVLDCSLALAWALPDETSKRADRFLTHVSRTSRFWVPAVWWYEVANTLTTAQRRHRVMEADRRRVVELYGMLPIQTDAELDVVKRSQGGSDFDTPSIFWIGTGPRHRDRRTQSG